MQAHPIGLNKSFKCFAQTKSTDNHHSTSVFIKKYIEIISLFQETKYIANRIHLLVRIAESTFITS